MNKNIVPDEIIEGKIILIRGKKVILDRDISFLYQVPAKALRQQVRRNIERFPEDFMFILNEDEINLVGSQFVTPSKKYFGGAKPYVFTEQGIAMLSSVLKSPRAIQVNIQIMRTFSKIREIMLTNEELRKKIEEIEKKYDKNFRVIFDIIKNFLKEKEKPKEPFGFRVR